jgi:hypothetical protein
MLNLILFSIFVGPMVLQVRNAFRPKPAKVKKALGRR